MDRPLRLAWWGTVVGLVAVVIGLAVFFLYALSEVLAHPGLSIVDGYWIGRLPWTGIGEGFTVIGATGAVVLGAATVWIGGGIRGRLAVFIPVAAAAFFWAVAMLPGPMGGPCPGCPLPGPDPFAYAYSLPQSTALFLLLPAVSIGALAFVARRGIV